MWDDATVCIIAMCTPLVASLVYNGILFVLGRDVGGVHTKEAFQRVWGLGGGDIFFFFAKWNKGNVGTYRAGC